MIGLLESRIFNLHEAIIKNAQGQFNQSKSETNKGVFREPTFRPSKFFFYK
jgi:hypothetical protein